MVTLKYTMSIHCRLRTVVFFSLTVNNLIITLTRGDSFSRGVQEARNIGYALNLLGASTFSIPYFAP